MDRVSFYRRKHNHRDIRIYLLFLLIHPRHYLSIRYNTSYVCMYISDEINVITNLRGLARQKQCTQALSLISLNSHNEFLYNFLIIPFSHHALLDTHNPPLIICTPPFSHHHAVPKYTLFTHMTLLLAQK